LQLRNGIVESLVSEELAQAALISPFGTEEQKVQKRKLYERKKSLQGACDEGQTHQQQTPPVTEMNHKQS
ncbi:hypothetical protein STEG23_022503, partial [Scotinomys teguina]